MNECNHEHHCIPGLEALLRTKLGDDLIVENYTATNWLSLGENYGSLVLKVDAVIRRKGKDSKSQKLHAVAKVPPLTQAQRCLFNSPYTFKKEAFMYKTILPAYKKFEQSCGINEEDIIDVWPEFYGSRLNLEFGDVFDDNAVILMENLKARGYYCGNRFNGLDIHHSRVTVKAIARFHALGIAMKMKNPDLFEVLKARSKSAIVITPEKWKLISEEIVRYIKDDSVLSEHYESCVRAMECYKGWTVAPEEPWSTIIHADFWINNILFHRNKESGLPDDVKFVDYQNYLFLSPLRELTFFLTVDVNHEVSTKNIPELIDLYHKTLISRLEIMGCDGTLYSRDKFDEQLPKDAINEFRHLLFMLRITTRTFDVNDPNSKIMWAGLLDRGSDEFYVRLRALVTGYAKRGWFCSE